MGLTEQERERAWWSQDFEDPDWAMWAEPTNGVPQALAAIEPALSNALGTGGRVLDLGCGVGRLTIPLARAWPGVRFVGVDVSPPLLSIARRRAKQVRVANTRFLAGDGRTLPRMVGKLDGAFSMLLFQHIESAAVGGYLRAVADRLVPGGVLRFQFSNHVVDDSFLAHGLDPATVQDWVAAADLEVVEQQDGLMMECWTWITARK